MGIAPVEPPRRYAEYARWLDDGCHGDMDYMAAPDHRRGRSDVRELLPGARSVVVVVLSYAKSGGDRADGSRATGSIARYARGRDYHGVLKHKLRQLAAAIAASHGGEIQTRACVDSAPVLERDVAERAGVGFVAKNTMLISPGLGSYTVLGELLVDVELAPTASEPERSRCGACRACIDACPTGAIVGPYALDARRCISYLTIEHRGAIPRELRPAIGTMVFGCDICQEVCPFNAQAPDRTAPDPDLAPLSDDRGAPDLLELLDEGSSRRRKRVDGTALRRANREQLLRNVCVALGNAGDRRAIPPLAAKLSDRSPLVRAHAAWALGQLGDAASCERALAGESDPSVRDELSAAISAATARAR